MDQPRITYDSQWPTTQLLSGANLREQPAMLHPNFMFAMVSLFAIPSLWFPSSLSLRDAIADHHSLIGPTSCVTWRHHAMLCCLRYTPWSSLPPPSCHVTTMVKGPFPHGIPSCRASLICSHFPFPLFARPCLSPFLVVCSLSLFALYLYKDPLY